MQAVPLPSAAESRANAAFEALMWALARPGLVRTLPEPGPAPVVAALIDGECAVHCADPALAAAVARTGAQIVALDQADQVFLDAAPGADLPRRLRCGSDLYPDAGATLICPAALGRGRPLRLTGPGCDGAAILTVGGIDDGFWRSRAEAMRYPMGFDIFLIDGDRVAGLPRSTVVEAL